jgi:TruD family tRNA pseudouridine synthase
MDSRQTLLEDDYYLQGLGIVIPGKNNFKNKGFIKLYTEDFIVEEITNNDNIVSINNEEYFEIKNKNIKQNFKATLVQNNIGTLEVVKKISKQLNIPETNIQYAGIKDNDALTAQKITIQNVSFEELNSISNDNFYFKDIEESSHKIRIGELNGNRFTLLVRLDKTNLDLEELKQNIKNIEENGFYNFYYSQRFGTLGRDNNHTLARLVIQKKYSEALFKFLTEKPKTCFKSMITIFNEAKENYGNWQ